MHTDQNPVLKALYLRSIEWSNWPAFLSALIVPIALIFSRWRIVIGCVLAATFLWPLFRYRFHSLKAAVWAAIAVQQFKLPISITSALVLGFRHQYSICMLALFWPLIHGFIRISGDMERLVHNFASEMMDEPEVENESLSQDYRIYVALNDEERASVLEEFKRIRPDSDVALPSNRESKVRN